MKIFNWGRNYNRNAISIGGDSDTLAAIAGAVAEARFGLDENMKNKVFSYLPEDITAVMCKLYDVAGHKIKGRKEDFM